MEVATATEASAPAASRRSHPFPWLDLAISEPYYFLHLVAFFSYFAARSTVPSADDGLLLRREIQAVLTFLVLFVVKIVKEENWETCIADSLLYAKGLLLAVTLVIDYWLTVSYLLGFVVIYAVAQQPPYDGLGHSNHLTPLQLEGLLTEEPTTRFWLVEFRTSFSGTCIEASNHLPTYILFDKATEVARFPEIMNESKKLLCQHFDLDRRLIEYLSRCKSARDYFHCLFLFTINRTPVN
uniref:Thioredoxin-related transmembrane protein 2 n=1 Tax=Oryza nivara TaxID=4536 RepID=A0A0E0FHY9_ORYNI